MSETNNSVNKKKNLTIEIGEDPLPKQKQQENTNTSDQQEMSEIQQVNPKVRKLSVDKKQEKSPEELLEECEDELDVLKTVIKHMDQNVKVNNQQEQDLSMAQYVSIVQRSIQSLRILTSKSETMEQLQKERLDKFCIEFDQSFREYQKHWNQNYWDAFWRFMSEQTPKHKDSFDFKGEVNQIYNYGNQNNILTNIVLTYQKQESKALDDQEKQQQGKALLDGQEDEKGNRGQDFQLESSMPVSNNSKCFSSQNSTCKCTIF